MCVCVCVFVCVCVRDRERERESERAISPVARESNPPRISFRKKTVLVSRLRHVRHGFSVTTATPATPATTVTAPTSATTTTTFPTHQREYGIQSDTDSIMLRDEIDWCSTLGALGRVENAGHLSVIRGLGAMALSKTAPPSFPERCISHLNPKPSFKPKTES